MALGDQFFPFPTSQLVEISSPTGSTLEELHSAFAHVQCGPRMAGTSQGTWNHIISISVEFPPVHWCKTPKKVKCKELI